MLKVTKKRQTNNWSKAFVSDQPPRAIAIQHRPDSATPLNTTAVDRWLLSSKHVDLLLLAACSCLLTVICHPATNLLQPPTSASSAAMQSSLPSTTSQINFYVKSALLSSFQEKGKQEESET